jgi:4'-phosphopantetheinyl transferase
LLNEWNCRLSLDVIHVWCVRSDLKVFVDKANYFQQLLCEDELGRASNIEAENVKTEFVINRGILRIILASYLGIKPREVKFKYNRNEKPTLSLRAKSPRPGIGAIGQEDIQFNLAHSYGLALYAFSSRHCIGADVEWMNRPSIEDPDGKYSIAERFFSLKEREYLSKLGGETKRKAFFKLWTAKEALLKARGENLGALGSRDAIDFRIVLSKRKGILRDRSNSKENQRQLVYSFWQFVPTDRYFATVVREGDSSKTKLQLRKLITEKQAEAWACEF